MPKAAVHKYDFAGSREDKIRASRKIAAMESESMSKTMSKFANKDFGLRIL
jgi:hypothetical protein